MYVLNNAVEKLSDKRNEAAAEEGTPDTERGAKSLECPSGLRPLATLARPRLR